MQNRNAVILSMGMLLEKVDTSGFIAKLLKKAKEENAEFVFTPELQKQAFMLSEAFNLGKVDHTFAEKLMQMLGIKTMSTSEFWSEWDNMLTVGNINEKIKMLQDAGHHHHALMYLVSDTNMSHLAKLIAECANQDIDCEFAGSSMTVGQFPLYASCNIGKNRMELIKYIVADIRAKELNKPDAITVILGNPANVKDPNQKQMAQKEVDAISAWCKENGVSVQLHNNSLRDTFAQMFPIEMTTENVYIRGC